MEYVLGSLWFWIGIIALVAVVGGIITSVIAKSNETKRYVADAANGGAYKQLADDTSRQLKLISEQLYELDDRLARVEKTLTDIPG
ncbi:MAG: hypothetical protein KKH51_06395 [Actinobacteria bacterium]|jgi:5-bromo-4-chloroindolyl phosphate hydrolysis protein|nr:hypothetical protein [Actinomycetota bacterium]